MSGNGLRTAALLVLFWLAGDAMAAAILQGFNANTLPRNDDGSSGQVPLGFEVNLFGSRFSNVYVNSNGNITFDAPLPTYTPFNLLQTDRLIIAPFFADVDTRAAGDPVSYGTGRVDGRPAFGVNWINVDYFSSTPNHTNRNSFQLILVSRADRAPGDFDIIFNYDRIEWEAGIASGADANGRGGSSARAGYAIGRGAPGSAFELAGSAINGAFLDGGANALVRNSRNSNVPGRYVFEIRGQASSQISTLTPFGNGPSQAARSDASGRFVVFQSRASNLVANDNNDASDVFLLDTRLGVTTRISVDNAGNPISGDAMEPDVSSDGRLVVFVAQDRGVPAVLGEGAAQKAARVKQDGWGVFLRNTLTGTTQRVGGGTSGGEGTAPTIAGSGNAVVFTAVNTDAAAGTVGQTEVYVTPLTRVGNAVTPGATRCVSCKSIQANGGDGTANSNGASRNPSISADGNWVAWETSAKNALASAAPACPNASSYVVLRNLLTGAAQIISSPAAPAQCGPIGTGSGAPQVSDNGGVVIFASTQPLRSGDANGVSDVYAYSAAGGAVTRVSETAGGGDGNGASTQPAVSGDGRMVAFISAATNLDTSTVDSNGQADLHVRGLNTTAPLRLSSTESGEQANAAANRPALNFDGSLITFDSTAGNLAPGAVGGQRNVFQRVNPLAQATLRSATWWRESEGGWGLFVFDQGNVMAVAWFTYDIDGEPFWLLSAVQPQADGSYRGDLTRVTGIPFNQGSGDVTETNQTVGNVTLRYNSDGTLRFDYSYNGQSQSKQLTRFPYGASQIVCRAGSTASRAAATNYSDVWWGGSGNPGWGLFITHVDNNLFALWYTYDGDREPMFFVIGAARQSDGSFTGRVHRQRNGTPLLQINDAPASPGSMDVGSATFRFSNGETGTFSYIVGAVSDNKPISRFQFGTAAAICESTPATR
ncbi:MAG TPA: nidogen-like domain-containing protein [Vicinamibacterales bacterium]|nr:nidogen-like domain-containing protein [Vicinamibacterales bacterium]